MKIDPQLSSIQRVTGVNLRRSVFLAYPFRMTEIRGAVERACQGIAELRCADTDLTDMHLLEKIEQMMDMADLSLFDLSNHNVNVAVEYGLARGMGISPIILYNDDPALIPHDLAPDIFSDLRGIDSLRYRTEGQLEQDLRARLPILLDTKSKTPRHAPRLQATINAQRPPDGAYWFIGELFNAADVPAERVQLSLGGYLRRELKPVRFGSIVPSQRMPIKIRYDHLGMAQAFTGMECVVVEYADSAGRKYEQRGQLCAQKDGQGITYLFDGLSVPTRLERFNLRQPPLQDP